MNSKQLVQQLKEEIKDIFQSYDCGNNSLLEFVNSYDHTISILNNLEKRELTEDNGLKKIAIENKYRIQRIVSKYSLMTSLIGIYDIFNEAFLKSSPSRQAMLSNAGAVFISKKNAAGQDELAFYSLEECVINNQQEELKTKLKQLVSTNDQDLDLHLQLWQGCEMIMPKDSRIILSFSQVYPSLYIKRLGNSDDEIFIEEHPWNVNYVASENFIATSNDSNFLSTISEEKFESINSKKASISKSEFKKAIESEGNIELENQTIDLKVLEALNKCDVVIQMPYITPRADVLLKVSFQDNKTQESNAEIILTTC